MLLMHKIYLADMKNAKFQKSSEYKNMSEKDKRKWKKARAEEKEHLVRKAGKKMMKATFDKHNMSSGTSSSSSANTTAASDSESSSGEE